MAVKRARSKRPRKRGRPRKRKDAARGARRQLDVLAKLQQGAAAWLLGISARTLRDTIEAPRREDGTYDGSLLIAWWVEREKRRAGRGQSEALERIRKAKASAAERRDAIERGKYWPIDEIQVEARMISQELGAELDAVARALGPEAERLLEAARKRFTDRLSVVGPKPDSPGGIAG